MENILKWVFPDLINSLHARKSFFRDRRKKKTLQLFQTNYLIPADVPTHKEKKTPDKNNRAVSWFLINSLRDYVTKNFYPAQRLGRPCERSKNGFSLEFASGRKKKAEKNDIVI